MDNNNQRHDSRLKNAGEGFGNKFVKKQVKKALLRTAAEIAAITSPIWGPIALIILIILIVLLVFIPVVFGLFSGNQNPNYNQYGFFSSPTPEASASATPTINPSFSPTRPPNNNPPTCLTVDQRLKSDFNINMFGTGCENRLLAWSIYDSLTVSARYKQLLANVGSLNIIFSTLPQPACHAYAVGNRFVISTKCIQQSTIRRLYIHEMGHKIAGANSSWRYLFPHENLIIQDRNCYNQGFLKTYVFRSGSAKGESFAESMLLYVTGGRTARYLNSLPIYNFKQECPNTYRIMRDNFFGGYEFN